MKNHYHDKDLNLDLTDEQIETRNKLVVKYMPLAMKAASAANNYEEAHYTLEDVQSAAYEALVATCGKHVRNGAQTSDNEAVNLAVYLKPRLKGAAMNFINREASTGNSDVSIDADNSDGVNLHELLSDTDTLSGAVNHDSYESRRRSEAVMKNIKTHTPVIREAIESLTLKQRYAIKCTQNGRTQKYIGDKLGISQQAAKMLQSRAYVAFRQQLEKKGMCSDTFFL